MKLYTYFRSSAAYRVRIALNLKGVGHESVPVHLLRNGGEHLQQAYLAVNPGALLPSLEDQGHTLTQSLAIIEYLDETCAGAALMPADALGRARVRALAMIVACEIHPLNNLRVLKYLSGELGVSDAVKTDWMHHWMGLGLATLESELARSPSTGQFCHGDNPGMADCCLVPQVFNAQRFKLDLAPYPTVARIHAACEALPAFAAAHPSRQPDSE